MKSKYIDSFESVPLFYGSILTQKKGVFLQTVSGLPILVAQKAFDDFLYCACKVWTIIPCQDI